jgi:hypothetical protein
MACWPANLVAAFFLALLGFDFIQKDFQNLPVHAIFGVVFVGLFWIVCSLVDERVSASLLLVPLVFLGIFMFSIWFTGQSLQQQGCCINCSGSDRPVKAVLVRKSDGTEVASTPVSSSSSGSWTLGNLGNFEWNPKASTQTIRRETNVYGPKQNVTASSQCVPLSLNATPVV